MEILTFDQILSIVKKYLWLSGIPYLNPRLQWLYYINFTVILITVIEESAFLISGISGENLKEIAKLAPCTGIGLLSLLKIASLAFKRNKMFAVMRHLNNLYNSILLEPNKIEVVKQDVLRVNSLTKYYFILNAILVCVYNFASPIFMLYYYLMKNEVIYSLPYDVLLPFPIDSWASWIFVYVHTIFAGFMCVVFFTSFDCIYCILTSQLCINFMCISNDIQQLDQNNTSTIKDIIKRHQFILELGNDLEDIFTVPNLCNMLVGSVQICAIGFSLMTGEWAELPGSILFLSSVLLQILMMSVFGENIINESKKVGEAAYSCQWLDMDEIYKKMILIIITRAQKPQKLTALKFYTICYGSFTTIISTSWSYFTILSTMYNQ